MGNDYVRDVEAGGSNPLTPTTPLTRQLARNAAQGWAVEPKTSSKSRRMQAAQVHVRSTGGGLLQ